MKKSFIGRTSLVAVAILAATLAAGCASVAVSNDAIEQNTATALNLTPGSFTITDRVDSGARTSYTVKTTAGKQYNCYVTGGVSLMGRSVSDPVCSAVNEVAKSAKQSTGQTPASSSSTTPCNALLKAAGKCS